MKNENKTLENRIRELEEIVREKNHTMIDMYNADLEISWSKKDNELQRAYEEKYGADLEYEEEG